MFELTAGACVGNEGVESALLHMRQVPVKQRRGAGARRPPEVPIVIHGLRYGVV